MTIRTKIATFGIIAALAGGMVGTSAPIASAAPVAAPTATSYFRAGATVNFPTTWTAGQPLTVTGQGFSPADLADPGKNGVLLAAGYVLIVGGIGGAIFLAVRKMRKE